MGVDFFECDECGETICDAGPYWTCDECRHHLCEDCEGKLVIEDGETGDAVCPFCERQTATDFQLLEYALGKLGLTRDQLFEEYQDEAPPDAPVDENP